MVRNKKKRSKHLLAQPVLAVPSAGACASAKQKPARSELSKGAGKHDKKPAEPRPAADGLPDNGRLVAPDRGAAGKVRSRLTKLVAATAPEIRDPAGAVRAKLAKPMQLDNAPRSGPVHDVISIKRAIARGPRAGRRAALRASNQFAKSLQGGSGIARLVDITGQALPESPSLPPPDARAPAAASSSASAALLPTVSPSSTASSAAHAVCSRARLTWSACLTMHRRWRDYAVAHLAASTQARPSALLAALGSLQLNFAYVIVTRCSRCPELVDMPALLLHETRNAMRLITPTSRHVTVPKPGTWLAVPLPPTGSAAAPDGARPAAASGRAAAVLEVDCGRMGERGGNAPWLHR